MHRKLGSATLSKMAFLGESNPSFSWEKSHWRNTVVKKRKKGKVIEGTYVGGVTHANGLPQLFDGLWGVAVELEEFEREYSRVVLLILPVNHQASLSW